MDGELILVGSRAKGEPGRGANREGFVEVCCQGGEEGAVVCGRGGGIDSQESNSAIGVNLGSKGEGEGAVGGTKDLRRYVREGGRYGVTLGVGGVDLSWSIKPACRSREGGGLGRGGGGGGGRSEGSDSGWRGLLGTLLLRGGEEANVIYGDAAHDRDAAHPWQPQENQKYI